MYDFNSILFLYCFQIFYSTIHIHLFTSTHTLIHIKCCIIANDHFPAKHKLNSTKITIPPAIVQNKWLFRRIYTRCKSKICAENMFVWSIIFFFYSFILSMHFHWIIWIVFNELKWISFAFQMNSAGCLSAVIPYDSDGEKERFRTLWIDVCVNRSFRAIDGVRAEWSVCNVGKLNMFEYL